MYISRSIVIRRYDKNCPKVMWLIILVLLESQSKTRDVTIIRTLTSWTNFAIFLFYTLYMFRFWRTSADRPRKVTGENQIYFIFWFENISGNSPAIKFYNIFSGGSPGIDQTSLCEQRVLRLIRSGWTLVYASFYILIIEKATVWRCILRKWNINYFLKIKIYNLGGWCKQGEWTWI